VCFRGQYFRKPLDNGGDVHVAMDGNLDHQHRCSAGDCPLFYDPVYFLPKSQVDEVRQRINTACKHPLQQYKVTIPDKAVDQCKTSYEAADGKKQKVLMDSFDDTSIMVLICCHDIPIFFANIDTPGKQQKYSMALIEHFISFVPL